jgi:T5SS/PEP-CTERM-associated repeat protein
VGARALTTYTWNGGTGPGDDTSQWTPNGTPNTGDSAIVASGTVLGGNNTQFSANTLFLGSAAFVSEGDATFINYMTPTVDSQTLITSAVPGASAAENSLLVAAGQFVNQGNIDADGPIGSTFTIQVTTDGTLPGTFINYNQISVESGNEMVIDIAGTSELMNVGELDVNGGTLVINAATNAIAGGYAPFAGLLVINSGGTLETNASYGTAVAGVPPFYAFADDTAGNTLKIDNVGSFAGAIIGFGVNDTIDVGTSLAVAKLGYNNASGILNLENAGGAILASLLVRGSNFQTGTSALSGGSALGFNIGTAADGDTIITTGSLNDVYNGTTGIWQTATNWSNGVPGTLDSTFVGSNSHTDFTLTTGTSAVQVGALYVVDHHATLQVTSSTTINSNTLTDLGGTVEVTNTLTTQGIRQIGGSIIVDPTGVLDLIGQPPFNFIPSNGTLTITTANTLAARIASGSLLVNGGTLNAAPSVGGGGGRIDIGIDGAGTPATVTVQSSGTNAALVTDTYTEVGSDPTSFGILTLNGNVTWTDTIDPHDTSSTGKLLLGFDNQIGNFPTGAARPPISNAASLIVENGATLIDQNLAQIGASVDSAGAATIESGGIWNIGTGGLALGASGSSAGTLTITDANSVLSDAGGMSVGLAGGSQAVLQILNGGTVRMTGSTGITVANSAGSNGTLVVSGTQSQLDFNSTAKGITVGSSGQGTLEVSNGGTITMNGTGGLQLAGVASGSGTVSVTGPSALIAMGTAAAGLSVGFAGTGLLDIENGGTVIENGNSTGIPIGLSAGANGLLIVNGTNSVLNLGTNNTGIGVGLGGTGSLQVTGGGTVTISSPSAGHGALNIGNGAGQGTVTVSGAKSSITTQGTSGFVNVGVPGNGVLNIDAGGLVSSSAGVFIGTGGTTASSGTVTVDNGTLTTIAGITAGQSGTGVLTVRNGGTVTSSGVNVGFGSGSGGTLDINGGMLTDTAGFNVGPNNSHGTVFVQGGGTLITSSTSTAAEINTTSIGQAVVNVSGGVWNASGEIIVGDNGPGAIFISNKGIVNVGSTTVDIGNQSGGNGTVTVSGGTLVAGSISVAGPSGSLGTLVLDSGGIVTTGAVTVGMVGVINMNGGVLNSTTPVQVNFAAINGFGTVGAGVINNGSLGISGGRLFVSGDLTGSGPDHIAGAATLEVGGTVNTQQAVDFTGGGASLQLDTLSSTTQGFAIGNWGTTDSLIIGTGATVTAANWLNGAATTGTLEVDTSAGAFDFTGVTLAAGATPNFTTSSDFVELACFRSGTRIDTERGEVAVEELVVGDSVLLAAHTPQSARITWIGHRTIDCARHPHPQLVWPVRIAAGAFGSAPRRDLFVSPDHAVYIDGRLIPAKHLIDGISIVQVAASAVTYYHIELPRHDVVLAEGLPAESYLAGADLGMFSRPGAPVTLFPDLASRVWEAEGCAPLVVTGPALETARQRIARRRRHAA